MMTKRRKEKLSASSKLPGPGTKVEVKPKSFHAELHHETIKGVSILCKLVSRMIDDIEEIKLRLDRLELMKAPTRKRG